MPIAVVFLYAIYRLLFSILRHGATDTNIEPDGTSKTISTPIAGYMNLGKVPSNIVFMTGLTKWGFAGLIANKFLNVGTISSLYFGISCLIALVGSVLGTRYISLIFTKIFHEAEPDDTTEPHLLGLQGRVISEKITPTSGTVQVEIPDGETITVNCRIKPDETNPSKGDSIIFIDYDPNQRIFDVKPTESDSG